jgi:CheY-like chemotaxis protein
VSDAEVRLAAAIDDELRQPLAVVVGYAELLRIREDEAFRVETAARIIEASQRLSARLDRLNEALVDVPVDALKGLAAKFASPVPAGRPAVPASRRAGVRRILLVDDDAASRTLLRITLPSAEFVVLEAGDAEDALDIIAEQPPALVVLDWNLPGRSGAEVLAELAERHPGVPVIVLTADGRQREAAAALGARTFLTKPFSPLELLAAVDELTAVGEPDQRP